MTRLHLTVKRPTQVQYSYNTTAIQELFLVFQFNCIALVQTAAIHVQQKFVLRYCNALVALFCADRL